jgi:hypothetical protein
MSVFVYFYTSVIYMALLNVFLQVEFPIPEQFKTTVRPTGLVTVAVENKG